jgi:hypothetical protein
MLSNISSFRSRFFCEHPAAAELSPGGGWTGSRERERKIEKERERVGCSARLTRLEPKNGFLSRGRRRKEIGGKAEMTRLNKLGGGGRKKQ